VEEHERRYYRRRAPEYDDWWLGEGAYAAMERPGWHDERARLVSFLAALPPARTVDVACGTGFLTQHLPGEVTGLDQSVEMLEIARARVAGARLVVGDGLALPFGEAQFERVFASHFYGHLRGADRERFLSEARRVAPRLLVVDSARRPDGPSEDFPERTLRDGSTHRVYKRWFEPDELARELGGEPVFAGEWFVAVAA
jgi:ubiquinone/menaquinone biosynthesis C-methylase UbiE